MAQVCSDLLFFEHGKLVVKFVDEGCRVSGNRRPGCDTKNVVVVKQNVCVATSENPASRFLRHAQSRLWKSAVWDNAKCSDSPLVSELSIVLLSVRCQPSIECASHHFHLCKRNSYDGIPWVGWRVMGDGIRHVSRGWHVS